MTSQIVTIKLSKADILKLIPQEWCLGKNCKVSVRSTMDNTDVVDFQSEDFILALEYEQTL